MSQKFSVYNMIHLNGCDRAILEGLLMKGKVFVKYLRKEFNPKTAYRSIHRFEEKGILVNIRDGKKAVLVLKKDKLGEILDLLRTERELEEAASSLPGEGTMKMWSSKGLLKPRDLEQILEATSRALTAKLAETGEVHGQVHMIVNSGTIDQELAKLVNLAEDLNSKAFDIYEKSQDELIGVPPKTEVDRKPYDKFLFANLESLSFQVAARIKDPDSPLWRPLTVQKYLSTGIDGIKASQLVELVNRLPDDHQFGLEHPYSYDPHLPGRPDMPVVDEIRGELEIRSEIVNSLRELCEERSVRRFVGERLQLDPRWCEYVPWHHFGFHEHVPPADTWKSSIETYRNLKRLHIDRKFLGLFGSINISLRSWSYVGAACAYLPKLSDLSFVTEKRYRDNPTKKNQEYLVMKKHILFERSDGFLAYVWGGYPHQEQEEGVDRKPKREPNQQEILEEKFPCELRLIGEKWQLLHPIRLYVGLLRQQVPPEERQATYVYLNDLRNLERCYKYVFSAVRAKDMRHVITSKRRAEVVEEFKQRLGKVGKTLFDQRDILLSRKIKIQK